MGKENNTTSKEASGEVNVTKVIETRELVSKVTFGVEQSIRLGDYESLKPSMYLAQEYITTEVNSELIENQKNNAVAMFDGYKKDLLKQELTRVQENKNQDLIDAKTLIEDTIASLKIYIENNQSVTLLTKVFKRLVKEFDDLVVISHKDAIVYSKEIAVLKNTISSLEVKPVNVPTKNELVEDKEKKETPKEVSKKLEPLRPPVAVAEKKEEPKEKTVAPIPVLEIINEEVKDAVIASEQIATKPIPVVKKEITKVAEEKVEVKAENNEIEPVEDLVNGGTGIFNLQPSKEDELIFNEDFLNELVSMDESDEIPEIQSNLFQNLSEEKPKAEVKIEKKEVPEIKIEKTTPSVNKKMEETKRAEIMLDDLPF